MLRGGVDPASEELLSRMLRQLAKAHLERIRDSGRIHVQRSCLLRGVPDYDGGELRDVRPRQGAPSCARSRGLPEARRRAQGQQRAHDAVPRG